MAEPSIPAVDPSPKPGDVTSFNQVQGQPPAPHPNLPPKGTVGGDPNRRGVPDEYMKGLDDLAKGVAKDKTPAQSPPPSTPEASETPGKTSVSAEESPKAPPSPALDPEDAELEAQASTFKDTKGLRQAWKEAVKREKTWKKEQAEVSKRIEEAEARLKGYDPKAVEATSEELQASRTRLAELEEKVRGLDYTHHPEFHEKHIKPLAQALEVAYSNLDGVTILDGDVERPATKADFDAFVHADTNVLKQAEKFGILAPIMVQHRNTIRQLNRARSEAITNAAKLAEESQKKALVAQQERATRFQSIAKQRAEELESKFPEVYKAREGDEEGNSYLSKGRELVGLLDEPSITDEDRVKVATEVRHRAAAFSRVLLDLKRTQTALDAANKKLSSYEKSEPGEGVGAANGTPKPDASASPMDRALKGLEALAKPR